ncbi:MAG: hypothetical protein JWL86_47 [Rhizobium sp.]|nr:hypothetical protein [Rhizobium sp.]
MLSAIVHLFASAVMFTIITLAVRDGRRLRNELARTKNARDIAKFNARLWEDTSRMISDECAVHRQTIATLRNPPRNAAGKFAKRAA